MTDARARWALLAILVVAFMLRLPGGTYPPGFYHDEAWYGMDAAATAVEGPSLWYPANNGREPLFIWLAAGFVALLGPTPAAVRLAAGLSGVLMVAAVYALTARLAGRRAALVAAALAAVAPWAVLSARTGFRAATLPAVLTMAAAATARAAATGRRRHAAVAGLLGGLTLTTYTAARLAPPIALAAWAAWRPASGRRWRVTWPWLLGAALVALPMAVVLATTPGALAGRAGQVALWRTEGGGALDAIAASARAVAGMVLWRGDANPRHNLVAGRPVLRPLAGLLWAIGCLVVLRGLVGRGRLGRTSAVALAAWAVMMALPTVLAEDAPHFLRGVGLQPLVWVTAGIGGGALLDAATMAAAARRGYGRAIAAFVAVAIIVEGSSFFVRVESSSAIRARYFAFESGATDLALAVDQSLGTGWRGGWAVAPDVPGRPVWLDRRLRDGWAAVPFLVPIDRVTLTDPYDPVLGAPNGVAFMVPYGLDLDRVWADRPPVLTLRLTPGALERGDLAPEATRMWVALERLDAPDVPDAGAEPLAVYANGMVLEWARVVGRGALDPRDPAAPTDPRDLGGPWFIEDVLELAWRLEGPPLAGEPRAVVRVGSSGTSDTLFALDGPLGAGVFPSPYWHAGDRLIERVPLADVAGDLVSVSLSLYDAGAAAPLAATDTAGQPIVWSLTIHPQAP